MRQRHLVVIHRYFHPDTPPYASILRDVAEHLGRSGFRVTVLTCQPSYNRSVVDRAPAREQISPNVRVVRWAVLDDRTSTVLKVLNLAWFCLRLVLATPRLRHVDAIMAASTPPVLVAATASWLARVVGAAFVYHKQDIYPEVTIKPGERPGAVAKVARWIDARTDRAAARVVVLSDDMAGTTARRGVPAPRIAVINNFDPWRLIDDGTPGTREGADGCIDVVFAGNLGRFQNLESLFASMVQLRDDPIRFHFFGGGVLLDDLRQLVREHQLDRVEVYGYRDPAEVAQFLGSRADLGIVSLAQGVINAAYPSKTLSYLRQGTPILALVEGTSQLAATVRDERIGCQAEPGDVPGLVQALRDLAGDPSRLDGAPERARGLYSREFSRQTRLGQWTTMFNEVAS